MAAGSTYTPIATTTLGSAAASYTFSSIPSTYTDLVLIYSGLETGAGYSVTLQFNGDTGTNYSETTLYGTGSSAVSGRYSNSSLIYVDRYGSNTQSTGIVNIMNYANTSTYKTALIRFSNASYEVASYVGLWRSTAAINQIVVGGGGTTLAAGTMLTLYGIQAA
jgi:hypothetical protein